MRCSTDQLKLKYELTRGFQIDLAVNTFIIFVDTNKAFAIL
jgi:hypothetical protein